MCETKENNVNKPALVKTLLTAKASEKLAFEVEEELKIEDPSPEEAKAQLKEKGESPLEPPCGTE